MGCLGHWEVVAKPRNVSPFSTELAIFGGVAFEGSHLFFEGSHPHGLPVPGQKMSLGQLQMSGDHVLVNLKFVELPEAEPLGPWFRGGGGVV